jgi:ABC-type nitrate/sulfonate/bicarbonate transport system permease component
VIGKLDKIRWLAFVGPCALLAIWFLASSVFRINPLLLPSPQETVTRLWALFTEGSILPDAQASAVRWFGGYALGCLLGIPIGLLMGASRRIYESLEFLVDFFRSLPVTAMFPLFLLLFGMGDSSKIAMVFASTVFVVILNSAYGVFHTAPARVKMAKTFGASRWQIFSRITLFDALPSTLVGMRTALSLSLIVVVVSEMFIGTKEGMGQRVFEAYQKNAPDTLYALILLLGLVGYAANKLFILVETRVAFWAGK